MNRAGRDRGRGEADRPYLFVSWEKRRRREGGGGGRRKEEEERGEKSEIKRRGGRREGKGIGEGEE